ncbi:hypothetical protein L207DRAFT_514822 [Hyaloscypha variabilis F]|uniref:Uncharacterized protein n=1 Tax=Hyaloscypha variabilis (strain UAMH 11265 / GT02V1 / F) TaxID=1149755 RepID=A0A2J6RGH1_HYAVF|nr:hypothetical protein L207DRAFT_514822 [Hyaloscypha variabilis F]
MDPFSILTLAIFVAGYLTARCDLATQIYKLAVWAWEHGVVTRTAKGFAILSILFFLFVIPVERLASRETHLHPSARIAGISAREQLRRRGSF